MKLWALSTALPLIGLAWACGSRSSLTGFAGTMDDGGDGVDGPTDLDGIPSSTGGSGGTSAGFFLQQFGTPEPDVAFDVAVDADGTIYVAGVTYGALDQAQAGDGDTFLRRYAMSGDLMWSFQSPSPEFDTGMRVALDASGAHVLVNAYSGSESLTDVWLFDALGRLLSQDAQPIGGQDLGLDAQGNRFIARAGSGSLDAELVKLSQDGSVGWTVPFATPFLDIASALVVLPGGDVVVVGATDGSLFAENFGTTDVFVARLTTDGGLVWGAQFLGADYTVTYGVAADPAQNLYVVGATEGQSVIETDGFVTKLTSSGEFVWSRKYGTSSNEEFLGVAIDAEGRIAVAGITLGTFGAVNHGNQDCIALGISPNGDLGHVEQFGTPTGDRATAIAAAPDGAFVLVGATDGDLGGNASAGLTDAFVMRVPAEIF